MKTLDLLIKNVRIADVVRLRLYQGWVGIIAGRFQYVEPGEAPANIQARQTLDGQNAVLAPGLIDAHMHIESSLITPRRFAQAVLPFGTTTILQDPHEIANVQGEAGVRYMMQAAMGLPLRIFTAIPSCIPATDETIETAYGRITAEEVQSLSQDPSVIALGELMDYQGLAAGSTRLSGLIEAAKQAGLMLEGHTPTLGGTVMSDYASYGITSDHTLYTADKLNEQLTKGFSVMIQAKSLTPEVVDAVRALRERSRVLLITDDVMPNWLERGHLSSVMEQAVSLGWEPMDALASATLRPAMYLHQKDLGLIAPGRHADFMLLEDLTQFPPKAVYSGGIKVAEDGKALFALPPSPQPPTGGEFDRPAFSAADFRFAVPDGLHPANIISMNQKNTFTLKEHRSVRFTKGQPVAEENLATIGVFLRQGEKPGALGLLAGLGLREGGFASSSAHDSHQLIVVGNNPAQMAEAANWVREMGGGIAFVSPDAKVSLALPIAGLISDEPISQVAAQFNQIEAALQAQGVKHAYTVLFLTLLALTVSPTIKMSDKGLVDVEQRQLIPVVG